MAAPSRIWCWAAISLAWAPAALADDDASAAMPTYSGKGAVTQAIDGDKGAILDIGTGITMTFPKGIPVGRSRLVTLKRAAKKPSAAQVQSGFTPISTPVDFSTPLSAGSAPIVLAIAQKTDPRKKSERLVLAVEVGTLCNQENKATKGKDGLCSGWEVVEADYETASQRLVAKLQSTGGMRLVFGLLPADK
jgi:hypothetical protein